VSTPLVVVKGAPQLRRALKQAELDLSQLREPYRNAAALVATSAKPRTPRRTGALAASVRPGATRTMGVIRAGKAAVPYANPIHWGWPTRGIKAQPWLSQTAQATEPQWLEFFRVEIEAIVSKVASST